MGHMGFRLCLAVTCHDPLGAFEGGIHDARGLWSRVDAVVVNATWELIRAPSTLSRRIALKVSSRDTGQDRSASVPRVVRRSAWL
jgi:hypothetical protein